MHHPFLAYVAVGEQHLLHTLFCNDGLEMGLFQDENTVRIKGTGQGCWVAAARDIRDLRSGKGDHFNVRIIPVDQIEVVEIPACRAHDQDSLERFYAHESAFLCHSYYLGHSYAESDHTQA